MARKQITKSDYSSADGQKRLMAESVGEDSENWISRPVQITAGDYGCDPASDGMFRMVPSGDVVDYAERCKRLAKYERR
jgi:hypothetical protein